MFDIKLMNKISYAVFCLKKKHDYSLGEDVENPDALMMRSAELQNKD